MNRFLYRLYLIFIIIKLHLFLDNCGISKNRVSDCAKLQNIYGGSLSIPFSWPWMVNIMLKTERNTYEAFCGGTIISETTIVTAAHCLNYKNATANFKVAVGIYNLEEVKVDELYDIGKVILHPRYNMESADSDIALLILSKRVTYTQSIQPICLPSEPALNVDHKGCYATGWGSTSESRKGSKLLRQVCLPVIPWKDCRKLYNIHFTDKMLCAGDIAHGIIDTCDGDSGGPLACRIGKSWTLYGIISWGYGCGIPNNPGIFTKVENFLDWIGEHNIYGEESVPIEHV